MKVEHSGDIDYFGDMNKGYHLVYTLGHCWFGYAVGCVRYFDQVECLHYLAEEWQQVGYMWVVEEV